QHCGRVPPHRHQTRSVPGDSADAARALDHRGLLGALRGKAPDPQRTGNRAKGYPNTDQGPVARLVDRYAVRVIWRIHRARQAIFGRIPWQELLGIAVLMTSRTRTVPLNGSRRIRMPCADRPMRMESPVAAA